MLSVNADAVARELNATAREIERGTEVALDRVAQVALNAKKRMVGRTYARPIPKGKNGKPKWTRSGAFQAGQTIESRPGQRTITVQGAAEKYEPRLANLPTGADGVNRTNAAAQDALDVIAPQVQSVFEQELRNAIRAAR